MCTGFTWLEMWSSGGSSELGNENSGSIKVRKFLDQFIVVLSRTTLFYVLFMCSLFNDVVSRSDYTALNVRVTVRSGLI
jgi:hypothetical protein